MVPSLTYMLLPRKVNHKQIENIACRQGESICKWCDW